MMLYNDSLSCRALLIWNFSWSTAQFQNVYLLIDIPKHNRISEENIFKLLRSHYLIYQYGIFNASHFHGRYIRSRLQGLFSSSKLYARTTGNIRDTTAQINVIVTCRIGIPKVSPSGGFSNPLPRKTNNVTQISWTTVDDQHHNKRKILNILKQLHTWQATF